VKNAEKVLTSASSGIHVTHPHTKHTVPDQKSEDDQNYTSVRVSLGVYR